jgi:Tol biopolymer transport system component
VQGTEGGINPVFSPDGKQLAFLRTESRRQNSLWRVGLDGTPPVKLADSSGASNYGPPSWGDDGWIYFIGREGVLHRVRESGSAVDTIATPDPQLSAAYGYVEALPGGKRLLVSLLRMGSTFAQHEIGTFDLTTHALTRLGKGVLARQLPGGRLLYLDADGVLHRVGFDARSGRLQGTAEPVANQTQMSTAEAVMVATSRRGDIAYRTNPAFNLYRRHLLRVDRAGHATALPLPVAAYSTVRVSPDGRRLVFDITMPAADGGDVAVAQVGDSLVRTLARTGVADYPTWTPDGKRIAWSRLLGGERDIVWQAADGSDSAQVLLHRPGEQWQVDFLPGSDRMVVREGNATGGAQNLDIFTFRVGGDSAAPLAVRPNVLERAPRASPDGRWIAYISNETGTEEVLVRPSAGGSAVQVSEGGGIEPVWGRTGNELFYKSDGQLVAASYRAGDAFEVLARRALFAVDFVFVNPWNARYDVFPGDSVFVMVDAGENTHESDARTILIQHPAFLAPTR